MSNPSEAKVTLSNHMHSLTDGHLQDIARDRTASLAWRMAADRELAIRASAKQGATDAEARWLARKS